MKTIPSCIPAVVALAGGLLVSCAPPATMKVPVSVASAATARSADKSTSGRLLAEVNAYRGQKGRNALVRNPALDRMAQAHCEFMRKNRGTFTLHGSNVSHEGFEERSFQAKMTLNIRNLAENVAAVPTKSLPNLVGMWAASKGHNQNMTESYTETGIGVVVDADGMVFATQLFGSPTMSGMALNDRLHSY